MESEAQQTNTFINNNRTNLERRFADEIAAWDDWYPADAQTINNEFNTQLDKYRGTGGQGNVLLNQAMSAADRLSIATVIRNALEP